VNAASRFALQMEGQTPALPLNFNIFMAFAAHLIGEPLSQYYQDHRVLCASNYAVVELFGVDLVQAISDPYREAHDFGARIEFPADGLPLCTKPLLGCPEDLAKLVPPVPEQGLRMMDRLRAIERFRRDVGGELPIMGWVEGALAEAADLRGVQNLLVDLVLRPEWVHELLEICTETGIAFACAQVEAGADIIGLGDAIASQISPAMYREFALPYERRIFDAVREAGGTARLHICGDITHLLDAIPDSGAQIVDLDWMVDIPRAVNTLPTEIQLCGNVDPVGVMLKGTANRVHQQTLRSLEEGSGRLLAGAGCEIPDGTPAENLHAQSEAIEEFSRR